MQHLLRNSNQEKAMAIVSNLDNTEHLQLGKAGEDFTRQWLKDNNYTILATNYRTKYGEIDIIAQQKNMLAFVEVKLRSQDYFNLSQVITASKQKKIIASAKEYALCHKVSHNTHIFRFDIALLHGTKGNFSLEYIPNAFTQPE